MAWLRIDDGFAEHHKISELTDREFRVWMRTLCYAARNNGKQGLLTRAMRREIVGFTPPMTKRFLSLGLLDKDEEEGAFQVHDWQAYNPKDPTAASRAQRYRDRNATVTESVTESVTPAVTERDGDRDPNGPSRAATRARPVPSPTPEEETSAVDAQQTTEEEDPDEPQVGGGLPPLGAVLKQIP